MIQQKAKTKFNNQISRPLIIIFLLCLCVWLTVNKSTQREAFASGIAANAEYYPLEVGNKWEFEKFYYEKDGQISRRYSTIIIKKQDAGSGMTLYYIQKNKEFLIKSKEGILTPSGIFLLKYPLARGKKWVSGKDILDQRFFKINDIGFSITIRGKTYNNCIRIIVTSDFHSILKEGKIIDLAFVSTYNYAPSVGPVLTETFEVTRSGDRKIVSRTELIEFKRKQTFTRAPLQISKQTKLIKNKDSFRFPEKGYHAPSLSPDDKWLFYRRTGYGFQAKEKWEKEIYYTAVDRSDQKLIPFCSPDQCNKVDTAYGSPKWSPDGKVLATIFAIGSTKWIGLVDFSGDKPRFIESFVGKSPFYWISARSLLYIDEYGNIMKKEPGKPSEPAVFFRSSYRERGYARRFQVSSDGTIIYKDDKDGVYLTNLATPTNRIPLFHDPKGQKSDPKGLKLSSTYDLSPIGKDAVFYLPHKDQNSKRMVVLVNLKTLEVIDTFSVRRHERVLWSSDGTKLAYLEDTVVQVDKKDPSKRVWPNPHFFVLDLESGDRQDLGIGVSDVFRWTPDGRHIIYTLKYTHESLGIFKNGIFIMRIADGKEIGQLSKISAHSILYISPSCKYIVWQGLNMDTFFVAENPFRSEMIGAVEKKKGRILNIKY